MGLIRCCLGYPESHPMVLHWGGFQAPRGTLAAIYITLRRYLLIRLQPRLTVSPSRNIGWVVAGAAREVLKKSFTSISSAVVSEGYSCSGRGRGRSGVDCTHTLKAVWRSVNHHTCDLEAMEHLARAIG